MAFFICFQKVMDYGGLDMRKQATGFACPKGEDRELWKGSYDTIALG